MLLELQSPAAQRWCAVGAEVVRTELSMATWRGGGRQHDVGLLRSSVEEKGLVRCATYQHSSRKQEADKRLTGASELTAAALDDTVYQ
jgi:hypothetical protein